MSDQAGPAGKQGDSDIKRWARFAENTGGEKGAADRPNDRVHRVPGGIDPRNFVGKKLEQIKRSRDPENERMAKDRERLVLGREDNPVLMNREAGRKNGQVKIDPRETGQAEGNPEEL